MSSPFLSSIHVVRPLMTSKNSCSPSIYPYHDSSLSLSLPLGVFLSFVVCVEMRFFSHHRNHFHNFATRINLFCSLTFFRFLYFFLLCYSSVSFFFTYFLFVCCIYNNSVSVSLGCCKYAHCVEPWVNKQGKSKVDEKKSFHIKHSVTNNMCYMYSYHHNRTLHTSNTHLAQVGTSWCGHFLFSLECWRLYHSNCISGIRAREWVWTERLCESWG